MLRVCQEGFKEGSSIPGYCPASVCSLGGRGGGCAAEPGAGAALALHLCPAVPQQPLALAFQGLLFGPHVCSIPGQSCPRCGSVAAPSPVPCSRRQLWLLLVVMLLCRETPESSWAQPNGTISLKQRTSKNMGNSS